MNSQRAWIYAHHHYYYTTSLSSSSSAYNIMLIAEVKTSFVLLVVLLLCGFFLLLSTKAFFLLWRRCDVVVKWTCIKYTYLLYLTYTHFFLAENPSKFYLVYMSKKCVGGWKLLFVVFKLAEVASKETFDLLSANRRLFLYIMKQEISTDKKRVYNNFTNLQNAILIIFSRSS